MKSRVNFREDNKHNLIAVFCNTENNLYKCIDLYNYRTYYAEKKEIKTYKATNFAVYPVEGLFELNGLKLDDYSITLKMIY